MIWLFLSPKKFWAPVAQHFRSDPKVTHCVSGWHGGVEGHSETAGMHSPSSMPIRSVTQTQLEFNVILQGSRYHLSHESQLRYQNWCEFRIQILADSSIVLEMKLMSFGGSESTHFYLKYDDNVYGSWNLAVCKCKMQRVCELSYLLGSETQTSSNQV